MEVEVGVALLQLLLPLLLLALALGSMSFVVGSKHLCEALHKDYIVGAYVRMGSMMVQ